MCALSKGHGARIAKLIYNLQPIGQDQYQVWETHENKMSPSGIRRSKACIPLFSKKINKWYYFFIPFFNRKITSDVKTGILWVDSICSINCRTASSSVGPWATKGQSNPISLQFIDAMNKTWEKSPYKFANPCEYDHRTICLHTPGSAYHLPERKNFTRRYESGRA